MVDYGIILSETVTVAMYHKLSSKKILDWIYVSEIEYLFVQSADMFHRLEFDLKDLAEKLINYYKKYHSHNILGKYYKVKMEPI